MGLVIAALSSMGNVVWHLWHRTRDHTHLGMVATIRNTFGFLAGGVAAYFIAQVTMGRRLQSESEE